MHTYFSDLRIVLSPTVGALVNKNILGKKNERGDGVSSRKTGFSISDLDLGLQGHINDLNSILSTPQ